MKKTTCMFFAMFMALLLPLAATANADKGKVIEISTDNVSLILTVNNNGELLTSYFGSRMDDCSPLLKKRSYRRFDHGTDPQAYAARGGRGFLEPALSVTHSDGDMNTLLRYQSHNITTKDGVSQVRVMLKDELHELNVELVYKAHKEQDVIVCSSIITNNEKGAVQLENFYSSYLPVKAAEYYLNHFHGAWAREMMMDETKLTHGIKTIESKKQVRATHTENPSFLLSLDAPMRENYGRVIAGALAWSGNYKLNFQMDEFDIVTISAGISPYSSAYSIASGERFTTPDMIYTYSEKGAGQASRNLHDWAREHGVWNPHSVRPTLLNSWEGVYFDFSDEALRKMIDDTADMGLEMFVLDDGWFANKYPRNNSTQGLGDWQVNKTKLPKGISPLADYAVSKGLRFGIWIEPEMVNPKSELAEKHPDWIVGHASGERTTMRNQWLLDMTNPKVQDFVFGVFDGVMKMSSNITYIKWDANRHVENAHSAHLPADKQSHFWVEYTKGLYSVYERIRAKYPNVIIQACASGGGRVEYGALKYHDEVWTSDNTDAMSRIYIQYGTNMIYPALVTGSHVSASPNHQTNNNTPLKFRFDIAMGGRLGMELQPKDLSEADKLFARQAISNYKSVRDLVMYGDLYRIKSPYDSRGYYSLMYAAKDKKKAMVMVYCFEYQGRALTPKLELYGLDPTKRYTVREINIDKPRYWFEGVSFSGSYLINEGLNPNLSKVYDSAVFVVEEAD